VWLVPCKKALDADVADSSPEKVLTGIIDI